jgi:hypothetical protein
LKKHWTYNVFVEEIQVQIGKEEIKKGLKIRNNLERKVRNSRKMNSLD